MSALAIEDPELNDGVEFVDREEAESDAERAIDLLDTADKANSDAWFLLQAVANMVGPASNVGALGVSWALANGRPIYSLYAACRDGVVNTSTGAPATIEEARQSVNVEKAVSLLARNIAHKGGRLVREIRVRGTGDALVAAVGASAAGRAWIAEHAKPREQLLQMVKVADHYGRDGVNPRASLFTHLVLIKFEDRAQLVRQFPNAPQAQAKAAALGRGSHNSTPLQTSNAQEWKPTRGQVIALSLHSGVTTREASAILRAVGNGRSRAKLLRAVNEAILMTGGSRA